MKALIDKRGQLEAEPAEAARWEYVPTGTTYAGAWEALDIAGRRDLLASVEFRAVACRWAVDAPAWFDPDRDTKLTFRGCRVYATWNLQQVLYLGACVGSATRRHVLSGTSIVAVYSRREPVRLWANQATG